MKGQSSVRGEEEITRKVREKPRETNIRESPIGYHNPPDCELWGISNVVHSGETVYSDRAEENSQNTESWEINTMWSSAFFFLLKEMFYMYLVTGFSSNI